LEVARRNVREGLGDENWRRMMKEPPNKGLDLTNPGAAQSVPVGPLCLLSGLAAQAHVGLVERA